ncbi:hypothetical protein EDB83DRAFT_362227 [Lactarius deliciosus]|nr:hypothetical protein EDB83DRAFT_362227 [Lactarius deliciosus]
MSYEPRNVRRQRMKILPVSYAMLAAFCHWLDSTHSSFDLLLHSVDDRGRNNYMANVHYIRQYFKVIIPAIILVIAYSGTVAGHIFLGIVILAVSKRARPGIDIFHVATTWITVYFTLTMTTNVLLASFPCQKSSAMFEAALVNHIHTRRELRSLYPLRCRCAHDVPARFL